MMFLVKKLSKNLKNGDEYKVELLEAIPEGEQVSIYEQGISLTFAVVYMFHLQANLKSSNY